jgi:hypothetical protein
MFYVKDTLENYLDKTLHDDDNRHFLNLSSLYNTELPFFL